MISSPWGKVPQGIDTSLIRVGRACLIELRDFGVCREIGRVNEALRLRLRRCTLLTALPCLDANQYNSHDQGTLAPRLALRLHHSSRSLSKSFGASGSHPLTFKA